MTYGTKHRIGHRSFIYDHFGPWMPLKMKDWFAPKSPLNTINLDRPGLVVWVKAIDPATGTNIDCQGIRMEFVDRHGDLFGQDTSTWFGGQNFYRVGHVFYCYPAATNRDATQLIATLPQVNLSILTNQVLWNSKKFAGTNEIVAFGVCPPGSFAFSDGNFDPSGPLSQGTSGWVGLSKRLSPIKLKEQHVHSASNPTVYVHADRLIESKHLAMRLQDEQGRFWIAEPEPEGVKGGIHPFLIKLPQDVTNVVPELVLLRPVHVEFLVKTPSTQQRQPP